MTTNDAEVSGGGGGGVGGGIGGAAVVVVGGGEVGEGGGGGKNERVVLLDDGLRYDLDLMEGDPLLDQLKEWDYPIFDLLDQYDQSILSAVSYFHFIHHMTEGIL